MTERPVALGAPKQRALLALLVLHAGEAMPRERIVDELWGEEAPDAAAASLQVYVHGLRRALGPERIETVGNGYRLLVEPGEVDVTRFERLVERAGRALAEGSPRAAAEDLRLALAQWRGPALADLAEQPVARSAVPWLEDRRLQALELRNDAELALGRHDALLAELEPLIREHPYRERLREQHVLALYRAGRQKDALEAYRAARLTLVDELGVEPGPALQELERAILRHDEALAAPAGDAPAAARLPRPSTSLVGRNVETAAVVGLFAHDDVRLLTLTGPGGTGKTRLALAAGEELARDLADGAVFVDLAPVTDSELVLDAIARALRVPEGDGALLDLVCEHLRDRSLLLVLDNFEQVLDAAGVVSRLLAAAARLRVLVTSRVPLRLSGEHEYPVPPLPVPQPGPATFEEVASNEAVRLFAARARAVDPQFQLTEENLARVATICRRLDGLPLAIELAAAQTRVLPPAAIEQHLGQALDVLGEGPRDAPARQRTLRATLDWSYRLLDVPVQAAFAALAVFAGGFSLDAAGDVLGAGGALVPTLGALVDASLVRRVGAGVSPRFAMLETVRDYALERLRGTTDEAEHARRHAVHFAGVAERAEAGVLANDFEEIFRTLDEDRENLRAALNWSAEARDIELEARLVVGLRWFWIIRGQLREGRAFAERAVADTVGADVALRARVLALAGTFPFRQGELDRARELWEEALALYRRLDDADGISRCQAELGSVALAAGDLERATEVYLECCRVFEQLGNRARLGTAVANLGVIWSMRGDLDAAAEYGERAIAIQRECDRDGLAVSLHNLARTKLSLGLLDEARVLLDECIELANALGYNEVIAHALAAAADIAVRSGRPETSARLLGGSQALFDEIGAQMQGDEEEARARTLADLHETLGGERLHELLDEGRAVELAELTREAAAAGA